MHLLAVSHGETLHMAHSDLNTLMARNRFPVTVWAFQGNLFSPKAPKLPLEKQGITQRMPNPQSTALNTGKGPLQGRTAGQVSR